MTRFGAYYVMGARATLGPSGGLSSTTLAQLESIIDLKKGEFRLAQLVSSLQQQGRGAKMEQQKQQRLAQGMLNVRKDLKELDVGQKASAAAPGCSAAALREVPAATEPVQPLTPAAQEEKDDDKCVKRLTSSFMPGVGMPPLSSPAALDELGRRLRDAGYTPVPLTCYGLGEAAAGSGACSHAEQVVHATVVLGGRSSCRQLECRVRMLASDLAVKRVDGPHIKLLSAPLMPHAANSSLLPSTAPGGGGLPGGTQARTSPLHMRLTLEMAPPLDRKVGWMSFNMPCWVGVSIFCFLGF